MALYSIHKHNVTYYKEEYWMSRKTKQWKYMFIPFILALTTYIITYGTIVDDNYAKETKVEQFESTENVDEIVNETSKEIVNPGIDRDESYNSVLLNFYEKLDEATISGIKTEIDIYCIYSKYDTFYTLDEAIQNGVVKQYKNNDNYSYSFLLKEGYKFNAKLNPIEPKYTIGWDDSKANLPIELSAIQEGNNQLNVFDITFNYKSRLLDIDIIPTRYS